MTWRPWWVYAVYMGSDDTFDPTATKDPFLGAFIALGDVDGRDYDEVVR